MDEFYQTKRQRLDDLKAQLDADFFSFKTLYQDLSDYFLPTRGRFVLSTDSNRGDRRNNKIIDPTGYLSARTLSSGMQAGITSPARPWKRLTTPDPDLAEYGPVREWLDVVDQRMTTYFLRSNLYNVLPLAYSDLGVFGTSCIFMDKDMDSVSNFMSFPLGSFRFAKNVKGQINVFTREFRMTVRQLIEKFGDYDPKTGKPNWNKFSTAIRNLWDRSQYETWIEVGHVIEPNMQHDPGRLESKFKPFSSCYYELSTREYSGGDERFLRESGYDYFPILGPRWQVTGQDVYGTDSPGILSLGDNKQLQHGEKRAAQAIDKMINPPLKATSGLKKTRASIVSGDITYLDDPNERFEAVHEVRIDLSHLNAKQAEVRQRIQRAFFEDLFLMLSNSDRREFTATEIMERKEEKLLALGPVLEQLNKDVLDPLIDNQFMLMNEAGLIPPAPEELQGMPLKVEYISIMAQSQKMAGIATMDHFISGVTQIAEIYPQALKKVDFNEYIDQRADAMGISARIVRSDDRVQELIAAEEQAMRGQQQVEAINQLSGAARNLGQVDMSKDTALTRLAEQAQAGQLVQQ